MGAILKISTTGALLAAILPVSMAIAQGSEGKKDPRLDPAFICYQKGEAYRLAAVYRDSKRSPEEALAGMQGFERAAALPHSFIKKAINNVYFDGRFANAGGMIFKKQMTELCMQEVGLSPTYKPLR